jgi:hypothetical protein
LSTGVLIRVLALAFDSAPSRFLSGKLFVLSLSLAPSYACICTCAYPFLTLSLSCLPPFQNYPSRHYTAGSFLMNESVANPPAYLPCSLVLPTSRATHARASLCLILLMLARSAGIHAETASLPPPLAFVFSTLPNFHPSLLARNIPKLARSIRGSFPFTLPTTIRPPIVICASMSLSL